EEKMQEQKVKLGSMKKILRSLLQKKSRNLILIKISILFSRGNKTGQWMCVKEQNSRSQIKRIFLFQYMQKLLYGQMIKAVCSYSFQKMIMLISNKAKLLAHL